MLVPDCKERSINNGEERETWHRHFHLTNIRIEGSGHCDGCLMVSFGPVLFLIDSKFRILPEVGADMNPRYFGASFSDVFNVVTILSVSSVIVR
jgi:hypothetical protein